MIANKEPKRILPDNNILLSCSLMSNSQCNVWFLENSRKLKNFLKLFNTFSKNPLSSCFRPQNWVPTKGLETTAIV